MSLQPVQRARACPTAGCGEWAVYATRDDPAPDGHIWHCSAGHHGPRVLQHAEPTRDA